MEPMYSAPVHSPYGEKRICVFISDILDFPEPIDILTTSAFSRSYFPSPKTLFESLNEVGISVEKLAREPAFDLRESCSVWLSKPLNQRSNAIGRIGCVEMTYGMMSSGGSLHYQMDESELLRSLKAYFQMLDIAAGYGVAMDTIAMPLLGAGNQHISADLTLIPIINACVDFLKRNAAVKQIYFIERSQSKAFRMAQALLNSYSLRQQQSAPAVQTSRPVSQNLVFISYASPDRNVADNLCAKLETRGIRVWYAPRNVVDDYATAIANAISEATHFVVILSRNSMASQHVLNEIDLAFQGLPSRIKFKPLRIDDQAFAPAFNYYLSRQHWMDAQLPPLEARLSEFADSLLADL